MGDGFIEASALFAISPECMFPFCFVETGKWLQSCFADDDCSAAG